MQIAWIFGVNGFLFGLEWIFLGFGGGGIPNFGIVSFNDICLFDENHGRKVFKCY